MYMETIFIVLALIIVLFVHRDVSKPRNFPPGPAWLPVVGNFLYIRCLMKKKKYQHEIFSFLSGHYNSDIIGLKFGENLVVVVSGMKLIQDVLTKEEFEGRPDNFFIRLRSMGTRKGITCTDGYLWHDQRVFVLRHLRNLGYGKQNMENILHDELVQLRKQLDPTTTNQKVRIGPYFAKAVLNTMWTLVSGSRLSTSKFYLDQMLMLLEKRTRLFDVSGGVLNHFPWLRFLVPSKTGYKLIIDINKDLKALFQEVLTEHVATYDPLQTRDLIDAFLHQMKSTEKSNDIYTDDQLIMVCLDLFIAGSQTTSNTLDFGILLMVLHQNIQKKVQKEIWSVIGRERLPSLNDRSKMPYVEAVINEFLRLCQVTPVAGPRRALKDTELDGYSIPKNTSILINLHSVNNGKDHWGDPEVFRPDRFLNADGSLKTDEHLIAFGLGRRRCLGETLARSCIFTFFTGILQHYSVLPVDGEYPVITPVPGITMAPQPYYANFVPAEVFMDKLEVLKE